MTDSAINWRVVTYTVGGCWLIFVLMFVLLGRDIALFLNPFPIVVKAIFGVLLYGYVGGTSGRNVETVLIYWTFVGLCLSWLFHKIRHKHALIVVAAVMIHIVVSALSLFPMMIINGR